MKKITLILAIIVSSIALNAQSYKTGVGIRGGLSNGLTVKHFISGSNAIEGILSTRWKGFNITGLYEFNNSLPEEGLDWYYGVGGHIGFWDGRYNNAWFKENRTYTVIGVDGIIGIEYTFTDIPLNLSLDYKPAFNLVGYSGFWGDEFALSVRYTIK